MLKDSGPLTALVESVSLDYQTRRALLELQVLIQELNRNYCMLKKSGDSV
jgi:hypothetical protein